MSGNHVNGTPVCTAMPGGATPIGTACPGCGHPWLHHSLIGPRDPRTGASEVAPLPACLSCVIEALLEPPPGAP